MQIKTKLSRIPRKTHVNACVCCAMSVATLQKNRLTAKFIKINWVKKQEGKKRGHWGNLDKRAMWRDKDGVASREKSHERGRVRKLEEGGEKDKRAKQERNLASNESVAVWHWVLPTSGNARTGWHALRSCKQGFCSLGTGVVWALPNRPKGRKGWGGGGWGVPANKPWGQPTLPGSSTHPCLHQKQTEVKEEDVWHLGWN